jgi:hypothetical protein
MNEMFIVRHRVTESLLFLAFVLPVLSFGRREHWREASARSSSSPFAVALGLPMMCSPFGCAGGCGMTKLREIKDNRAVKCEELMRFLPLSLKQKSVPGMPASLKILQNFEISDFRRAETDKIQINNDFPSIFHRKIESLVGLADGQVTSNRS